MAVTFLAGLESADVLLENVTITGTGGLTTLQHRTGLRCLSLNTGSGASNIVTLVGAASAGYLHFGLYVNTLPSIDRVIFSSPAAGNIHLKLTPAGALAVYLNTTLVGTSSAAFATTGWHWVGVRQVTGTSVAFLQIDGSDAVSGTATVTTGTNRIGPTGTEASAVQMFIDDIIEDSAGFLAPSNVIDLLPTGDNIVGTGWTLGSGGTTGLWDAVNNQPPTAGADPGTTTQIRNATSNANVNYDATMQTYTVGGVGAFDTMIAVQPVIATAAPVATSAKLGTVGNVSNPTIANVNLAAGGTAGAFWSGVTAASFSTGWKTSGGTIAASPSVILGTAPVMRVQQVTASTRIAMVAYMALRIAWTPGVAPAANPPYVNPYPPLLAQ